MRWSVARAALSGLVAHSCSGLTTCVTLFTNRRPIRHLTNTTPFQLAKFSPRTPSSTVLRVKRTLKNVSMANSKIYNSTVAF